MVFDVGLLERTWRSRLCHAAALSEALLITLSGFLQSRGGLSPIFQRQRCAECSRLVPHLPVFNQWCLPMSRVAITGACRMYSHTQSDLPQPLLVPLAASYPGASAVGVSPMWFRGAGPCCVRSRVCQRVNRSQLCHRAGQQQARRSNLWGSAQPTSAFTACSAPQFSWWRRRAGECGQDGAAARFVLCLVLPLLESVRPGASHRFRV